MENEDIRIILERQKQFFASEQTLDIMYRLDNLKKLRSLILNNEAELKNALWKDFHKPGFEVIATETQFVLQELNVTIRKLRSWSRPRRVRTPLVHFIARSYIAPQPYGQVLIFSPWNFPVQLALVPVIGAIAAGNCVILKVSQQVPNTSSVMEKVMNQLPGELVSLVRGDHSISEFLLNQKFDYIFFTGSSKVGQHVMEKAASSLTPVSLELGGKSPCVVAADARLDFAAKRIAWGKFINAGQVCVSPDYLLIDKRIKDKFIDLITKEIRAFYGDDPSSSNDFARIISPANVTRLSELMKSGKIVTGGTTHKANCYVAPTIITDVKPGDPIMQEEIFGTVLPVIDFENFDDVYRIIEMNPRPLSTYIFTKDKKLAKKFLSKTQSGTAAINDTVMQIASPYLPHGGIGRSGLGRYHGRKSFETFSNMRSVLVKSNLVDVFLRYPPYSRLKENIVAWLMH